MLAGNGSSRSRRRSSATFEAPTRPTAREPGYLVVRPEFLRFLDEPAEADNAVAGALYNEYALGSRMQYQVRVGDKVFVVEKLASARPAGDLDQEVIIGWDAGDSIFVPG